MLSSDPPQIGDNNTLRFLLAEDHPLVVHCVKEILKEFYSTASVTHTDNIARLINLIKENKYDLLMLDIMLSDGLSLSNLEYIKTVQPDMKVIVLTTFPEDTYARWALQLGADGFVNKTAPFDEVANAIKTVINGRKYLSQEMLYQLSFEKSGKKKESIPFNTLSEREFEIMWLLLDGKTVTQIAELLHLQRSTISTHKIKIFEKLNITNLFELNQMAIVYDIKR